MKNHILLLILIFLVLQTECEDDIHKNSSLKRDNNQYKFIQHCFPEYCYKSDPSGCIWPEYLWTIIAFEYLDSEGKLILCPEQELVFNEEKLLPIKKELLKKWGVDDVEDENSCDTLNILWQYHAACSNFSKEPDGALKFFKKSLELYDKYNIENILRQSNIVPGNNYTGEFIRNTVIEALNGIIPEIICAGRHPNKVLYRVGIYLDDSFNPINCLNKDCVSSCPLNETISYIYPRTLMDENSIL